MEGGHHDVHRNSQAWGLVWVCLGFGCFDDLGLGLGGGELWRAAIMMLFIATSKHGLMGKSRCCVFSDCKSSLVKCYNLLS
jgi:hypothetical protein